MIVAVLGGAGRGPDEVRALAAGLAGRAGMIELRLDLLDDPDPAAYLSGPRPLPFLVTCRAAQEGGAWRGDHPTRLALLQRAIDLGAEWVDVEHGFEAHLVRRPGTKILASRHDFQGVPDDLPGLARRMAAGGADAVKIVVAARRLGDVVPVFDLLDSPDRPPVVALAMGAAGLATRVLGPSRGALWTYAARTAGEASAPGQLSLDEMIDVYRLPRRGGRRRCSRWSGSLPSTAWAQRSTTRRSRLSVGTGSTYRSRLTRSTRLLRSRRGSG